MTDGGTLFLITALHIALTGAPGVASALFAAKCGIRGVPVLLGIGLAGTGVTAMLVFWGYFADPSIGRLCAYGILLGSIAIAVWSGRAVRRESQLLRRLRTPLLLWILGSFFLVFFGFFHGGTDHPVAMSATRFSGQLPSDSEIPLFFSDWFFHHGHHGAPPVFPGDWLSSDRPPLQIGYVLAQRTFGWDTTGLNYQVLGVVLQQLWIVGLWALLDAARVRGATRTLTMITVLVSDVAIVHGFFVWPKMLAAAFLLAAAALLVAPQSSTLRREPRSVMLLGGLFALALLAHGASAFGIIPLLGLAAVRGLPSWRWVGAGLLAAAVLLVPWSEYQRSFDPPGNRVTKWMLAGVTAVDGRDTPTAMWDSYREGGLVRTLDNKAQNFVAMSGGTQSVSDTAEAVSRLSSGQVAAGIRELRRIRFFWLLPSLGLFIVAPFVMVAARARGSKNAADWRFAVVCISIVAVGCLAWGILLFGSVPARASIHVGSLALPILALCGAVAGLRASFPRFANPLIGINCLAMLVLYAPALDPVPGSGYSALAAVAAITSLAGFGLVAFRADTAPSLPPRLTG